LAVSLGAAVFGSSYVLPQFTQLSLGFTPTLSGLLFLLRALPIALVTPVAVRLSGKLDARWLLGTGFIVMGTGGILQANITTAQATFWDFGIPLALTGIGAALLWIPLSIAVLSGTPAADGGKATAFINLAIQLGASVAVALLAVFLHQRETFQSSVIGGALTPANPVVQHFLAQGGSLLQLAQTAYAQAAIAAFADVQYLIGGLAFVCLPLIFLINRRKQAPVSRSVHIEMG
jgi:DHA2 family multidrug resistance protein